MLQLHFQLVAVLAISNPPNTKTIQIQIQRQYKYKLEQQCGFDLTRTGCILRLVAALVPTRSTNYNAAAVCTRVIRHPHINTNIETPGSTTSCTTRSLYFGRQTLYVSMFVGSL